MRKKKASLPMYDWPETHELTEDFWQKLRVEIKRYGLGDSPENLTRTHDLRKADPSLFLSQTCGYPLARYLRNAVYVLGTPTYRVAHHQTGYYSSVLLRHKKSNRFDLQDFENTHVAINSTGSQSGCNAIRLALRALKPTLSKAFFDGAVFTGSHRESIKAVAEKRADICAVDPVSWALSKKYDDHSSSLEAVCQSPLTPALPIITSRYQNQLWLAQGVSSVRETFQKCWISAIESDKRFTNELFLTGLTFIKPSCYYQVPCPTFRLVRQHQKSGAGKETLIPAQAFP